MKRGAGDGAGRLIEEEMCLLLRVFGQIVFHLIVLMVSVNIIQNYSKLVFLYREDGI